MINKDIRFCLHNVKDDWDYPYGYTDFEDAKKAWQIVTHDHPDQRWQIIRIEIVREVMPWPSH